MTTSQNINKQKRAMKMRVVYKRTSFNFLRHVIIEEKKEISREKEADQITLNTEQTSIYPCLDFCSDINVKTYMYECLVLSHVYFYQYLFKYCWIRICIM